MDQIEVGGSGGVVLTRVVGEARGAGGRVGRVEVWSK